MNNKHSEHNRSAGRKFAEWVSLFLSAAIILGLAGYLFYEALQQNGPIVPVEVEMLNSEIAAVGEKYVLPVRVANRGQQTLRDLKLEVSYQTKDATSEKSELLIDYLGERSSETVYFYFDQHPGKLHPKGRAASYRVE